MQDKKYLYSGLAAFSIVLVAVFGWNYLVSGTTIGTDIETVNFLVTGTTTLATTTIGTNFYIDEVGAASTTGAVIFGSTLDVASGVSTLSGGIVNVIGTTTLGTTTIGTNFYVDETGAASTTGAVILGSTLDVASGVSTLSGGIVNVIGTTTLGTTTIGTNFYIDETGAASTTGAVIFGSTLDVASGVSTLSNVVHTGTSTFSGVTTIGTNFYIDDTGAASTTGAVILGSTLDVASGVSTLSGGIVNVIGTTTLGTTTIGTNFYVDETGAASTTGAVILGSTLTVTGETKVKGLIDGGATTTLATGTDDGPGRFQMTAANFCDNSLVFFEEESASSTVLYLPSASALIGDCIPDEGDRKSIYLINNTDDVASTTVTASTSINLKMSGEADAILNSLFGGWATENDNAWIECINRNDTEVDCRFQTILPAD